MIITGVFLPGNHLLTENRHFCQAKKSSGLLGRF